MKNLICTYLFFHVLTLSAQWGSSPVELKIDTSFAYFQFYNPQLGKKFKDHFDGINNDKVVFVHFGGSHIQAGKPIAAARSILQEKFGNGGLGYVFNYKAANTYGSIVYNSSFTGKWTSRKSYQGRSTAIPVGFCGMTVESWDINAALKFDFKKTVSFDEHIVYVFFENDSLSKDVSVFVDTMEITEKNRLTYTPYGLQFYVQDSIHSIELKVKNTGGARFRFYGLSVEKEKNKGLVYHPAGVGSAAYRSFLIFDKYEDQANVLKPDIAVLDFGTNDIVYYNTIDPKLEGQVLKAIEKLRKQNPEILIVLTSTQDLYFKKRVVDACIDFRDLMDTIARKQNCFLWNFYDLAGGKNTIRDWNKAGYALADGIHLTNKGYDIKGELLALSIEQTLKHAISYPLDPKLIQGKIYIDTNSVANDTLPNNIQTPTPPKPKKTTPKSSYKYYKVRSGDTLSQIADRHRTTVTKIKKANGLRSNLIRPGQVLKIPK